VDAADPIRKVVLEGAGGDLRDAHDAHLGNAGHRSARAQRQRAGDERTGFEGDGRGRIRVQRRRDDLVLRQAAEQFEHVRAGAKLGKLADAVPDLGRGDRHAAGRTGCRAQDEQARTVFHLDFALVQYRADGETAGLARRERFECGRRLQTADEHAGDRAAGDGDVEHRVCLGCGHGCPVAGGGRVDRNRARTKERGPGTVGGDLRRGLANEKHALEA